MNLFISRKPRIKRSGNFPGQWSKLRGEEGRENIVPISALIKGAEGDGEGKQEGSYPACARLPRLMSLKGQMPLQKINGVLHITGVLLHGHLRGPKGPMAPSPSPCQTGIPDRKMERVNYCKCLKCLSGITQ